MQNLYKTAAVVTVFTVFEHFLGFLYRIILSRTLGSEGLGIYQVALTVFAVFLTMSASGLPITLSRVISKHRAKGNVRGEHAATSSALLIALLFSVPITVILFLLRAPFSRIFADPRSADLFYILILGLSFTSVYAIIRGCFWGNRRFFAYSLIELIEEIIMIVVGVLLIVILPTGLAGVNSAAVAVLVSYLCSFSIAAVYFFARGGKLASPRGEFLPLLSSSMPVTAMRTSSSLIGSLISVLFPMRLMSAGLSASRAMSEYGVVYGMVMPILMMPSTFISSIALVLVPELAECFYKKDRQKLSSLVEKALCSALLIAGALIPFFVACGESVGIFLFSNAESGKLIAYSAALLLPMSLTMMCTSMLNSMNCEKHTLVFFLCGSAAMLLCVWFLPKYMGCGALILGMGLDYTITAVCSLVLIKKRTGKLPSFKFCFKLLFVVLTASLLGWWCKTLLMQVLSYIPATLLTALAVLLVEVPLLHFLRLFNLKALFSRFAFKRRKKGHAKQTEILRFT